MKILVINCGSSSLKYQLFDMETEEHLAKGLVERIGLDKPIFKHQKSDEEEIVSTTDIEDHAQAVQIVLETLTDNNIGVLDSVDEIDAIGHRVLHGGDRYSESIVIDSDVIDQIKACIPLAPLHNPANLTGIEACQKFFSDVPMVAVFDTAFHQTMPQEAYTYAIPYDLATRYHIRKFGFHGISHQYVAERAKTLDGKRALRLITCHLGNGCSLAAVKDGNSIDTTMGLTPLEGLIMGTRSGSIDPSIIKVLSENEDLTVEEIDSILNKESGVLGISGISNDFRDLEKAKDEGDSRASLALETFYYHVRYMIGAYAAILNGVEMIVFTAGIGENSPASRREILKGLEYLGISIDEHANDTRGKEIVISKADSKVKVMVIPTNEELMIARETRRLAKR